MSVKQSPSMLLIHDVVAVLQSRMYQLNVVTDSYSWLVTVISWFFIALALSCFLPIAVLIAFDFFLWITRLVRPTKAAAARSRRRREPLSHTVAAS